MIKLAISGCCGKMGKIIIALSKRDKDFTIAAALEHQMHPGMGQRLSQMLMIPGLDIDIQSSADAISGADVLIEFTNPTATIEHLDAAVKYKKPMVIGTTGLEPQQNEKIKQAAHFIPILYSPNMSLGVNLVLKLVKQAAEKLDNEYKIDIVETHHIHKKDAPSGTAKQLVELIRKIPSRSSEHIKVDSIREDEVVGDHQIRFNSPQDLITIKHSAKSRDIFARGALVAAKFILKQQPGLYDMQSVIG